VKLEDTIQGLQRDIDGKHDDLPEHGFLHEWHDRGAVEAGKQYQE